MADHPCLVVIVRTVGRSTLGRALQSIAEQTLLPAEQAALVVIVVDAMGRGLQLPDTQPSLNVQVIGHGAPLDRALAAQAGLETAHAQCPGSWALFLDDDDELLPDHLPKLSQAMRDHPHAVGAHTGVVQVQPADTPGGARLGVEERARFDRRFDPWELLACNHLPIHSVMFDTSRVCGAGVRFDAQFDVFEDWDFWLQVQRVGDLIHVPGVSARYWIQAAAPESMLLGQCLAQSAAQGAAHGNEAYWKLWNKWWHEAPQQWWAELLACARTAKDKQADLEGRLHVRAQQLEQAQAYQSGLEALRDELQDLSARLRSELDAVRLDLSSTRTGLSEANTRAHNLALEREQLQLERRSLQRTQAQAEHALALSQQQVRLLLGSSSWRLTRPLRALKSAWLVLRQLQDGNRRRDLWWKIRHRSFRRAPLLRSVWPDPYDAWCAQERLIDKACWAESQDGLKTLNGLPPGHPKRPLLSVLMPTYNPPLAFLDAAIESLRSQWYADWELCIADDASTAEGVLEHLRAWARREPRIRLVTRSENGHISAASNSALQAAGGEWVVLMDQDDLLPPKALWCVVQAINEHPEAGLFYSDEDKVDEKGRRFGPYFKPAFDPDLLRGQNLISHLGVYRRALVLEAGGFRLGYEGSQDHDLALRCVDLLRAEQVVHIPQVLYHWRVHEQSTASGIEAKPYALDAGLRAVQDHLERSDLKAEVLPHPAIPHHVVLHRSLKLGEPTRAANSASAWRLLCWGSPPMQPGRSDGGPLQPASGGLAPVMLALPGQTAVESEPSWLHACSRVKLWAAAVDPDGQDFAVLMHSNAARSAHWSGEPLAWLAHTAEPGVGAVGVSRRDQEGRLRDAGWLVGRDGSCAPIACGMGLDTHGYYGQLCLAHGVSALHGAVLALRLQSIDPDAPGLGLKPGWRMVWTPVAAVVADWQADTPSQSAQDRESATLVISAGAARAASSAWDGYSDPSYSPHLCELHRDHRLAINGVAPQTIKARTR
jgi:GT2 family glycosyltransferase